MEWTGLIFTGTTHKPSSIFARNLMHLRLSIVQLDNRQWNKSLSVLLEKKTKQKKNRQDTIISISVLGRHFHQSIENNRSRSSDSYEIKSDCKKTMRPWMAFLMRAKNETEVRWMHRRESDGVEENDAIKTDAMDSSWTKRVLSPFRGSSATRTAARNEKHCAWSISR